MPILAKGTKVRQIVNVIKGEIKRPVVGEGDGKLKYVVGWKDENGTDHERAFEEEEIEVDTDLQ